MTSAVNASEDAIAAVQNFGREGLIELIKLTRGVLNEEKGWEFTIRFEDGQERQYRTDASYEGMWLWSENQWEQIAGTGQFSLSANQDAAVNQIMRRWSEDKYTKRVK